MASPRVAAFGKVGQFALAGNVRGVAKNVTPEGKVEDTRGGTAIGTTLEFYINRPRPDEDRHGRGPGHYRLSPD
jgi:hypothetical protein